MSNRERQIDATLLKLEAYRRGTTARKFCDLWLLSIASLLHVSVHRVERIETSDLPHQNRTRPTLTLLFTEFRWNLVISQHFDSECQTKTGEVAEVSNLDDWRSYPQSDYQ